MLSPHASLLRLLRFLGLGVLALLLLGFSFFWIVFHHRLWINELPDSRLRLVLLRAEQRLWEWRVTLPAKDSDGDGVADWLEVATKTNPHDATETYPPGLIPSHRFFYRGERTRLELRLWFGGYPNVRWPTDTEIAVKATSPILLPKDAGRDALPTTGPHKIKVSPDGRMECDVIWNVENDEVWLEAVQTRSGVLLELVEIKLAGWRLPERPSRIRTQVPDTEYYYYFPSGASTSHSLDTLYGPPSPLPHLQWDPQPDKDIGYAVEIARADMPADWRVECLLNPSDQPSVVIRDLGRNTFVRYHGKLLYRVFPVSGRKPGAP